MTRQWKKLVNSVYECKYHAVFYPIYRYKILEKEVGQYLRQKLYQLCQQRDGIEFKDLNIEPDHVHVVLSIAPKYEVSKVIGYLKGKTVLDAFDRFPQQRKRYWDNTCGHVATVQGQWAWTKKGSASMSSGKTSKNRHAMQGQLFD